MSEIDVEEGIREEVKTEEVKARKIKRRGPGKRPSYLEINPEEYDGERILTVRFYPDILSAPKWKRAKKAMKVLRQKVVKYVKNVREKRTDREVRVKVPIVWISPEVNEIVWSRGAKNPPRRIRVRVLYKVLDAENGRVELKILPM